MHRPMPGPLRVLESHEQRGIAEAIPNLPNAELSLLLRQLESMIESYGVLRQLVVEELSRENPIWAKQMRLPTGRF